MLHEQGSTIGTEALQGVISVLLPVAVGAAIGFLSSWWFAQRADRNRALSLGYSLFFRASAAANAVLDLHKHIAERAGSPAFAAARFKWQMMNQPIGFDWHKRVEFAPDELALLAMAQRFGLINDLIELGRGHDLLHIVMGEYSTRRETLTARLLQITDAAVSGKAISMWLSDDDLKPLAPDMMLVDDLLAQLIVKSQDISAHAKVVAEALGPAIREALADSRYRGRLDFGGEDSPPLFFRNT